MNVALLYDRVNRFGGAERVMMALHELFPKAPLYTLVHDTKQSEWAKNCEIVPTWMQRIPLAKKHHEWFPVIPIFAYETIDFKKFDVVISVTATEAKGIITAPSTTHICYCLTPTRYIWTHYNDYFRKQPFKTISLPFVSGLRVWDQVAGQRPDVMVAISKTVAARIYKYYRRQAPVIYPPVDTDMFTPEKITREHFLLIVSRAVHYKHIDIAIAASQQLKIPLKIVGIGNELTQLKKSAGSGVEFLGDLTDSELIHYYRRCRALIFAQEEDFGLVAVEAMACGSPVIAYGRGGATETVISGITGEFFHLQTVEALKKTLLKSSTTQYNSMACRKQALQFSKSLFMQRFKKFVTTSFNKETSEIN